jgi:hypothetical protein
MGELPRQIPQPARAFAALDLVAPILLEAATRLPLGKAGPRGAKLPEEKVDPLLGVEPFVAPLLLLSLQVD